MKNLAKLFLFFSVIFIIIFLLTSGFRYLSLQVDLAGNLQENDTAILTMLLDSAIWALSLVLYGAIILSLGYAARREIFMPAAMLIIMVLSLGFNYLLSFSLNSWKQIPPAKTSSIPLGENGLILSNTINNNETAIVLLKGISEPLGPRVISIPGRPLQYHETAVFTGADLPSIPFGNDEPWYIKNLRIDIRLSSEHLQKIYNEGMYPYLIYAGALIFLLCSFCFVNKLSAWPLANLIIGILIFRGILAVETLLNSQEMQNLLASFFKGLIPTEIIVPSIFVSFALLLNIYSILVYIAKRRVENGD